MVDIRSINMLQQQINFWLYYGSLMYRTKELIAHYILTLHIFFILLFMEKCETTNKSGMALILPNSNQFGQIHPPPAIYGPR